MTDRERAEAEYAKAIIRASWSDHMWNFEEMQEPDQAWLLRWAGHPAADRAADEAAKWAEYATPGAPA